MSGTFSGPPLLVLFALLSGEGCWAVAPEGDAASGDNPYQLSYTVSEWTQSETLNLNDGDTQTFQVDLDETTTAVLSAVLTITYTDTGETVTAACDDIVTSPDYSGLTGPFSESDDGERSTNACGSTTEVGSIVPNAALSEYATGAGARFARGGLEGATDKFGRRRDRIVAADAGHGGAQCRAGI